MILARDEGINKYATRCTVEDFVELTGEKDPGKGLFEIISDRFLIINLDGRVWTKSDAMIAHTGQIKISREGILEHGLGKFLKRILSGGGIRLTKAQGKGRLYLADGGKKIFIINLEDETLYVNGNDLLAFQEGVDRDIKRMQKATGTQANTQFGVKLSGKGSVAITTHFEPLTLRVTPQAPITTDPKATVAWSESVKPGFRTDISFKNFFGPRSGESIQMLFRGDGFVVIQPQEEIRFQAAGRPKLKLK
jgi:uncharacterized protein (AIM24 family)